MVDRSKFYAFIRCVSVSNRMFRQRRGAAVIQIDRLIFDRRARPERNPPRGEFRERERERKSIFVLAI